MEMFSKILTKKDVRNILLILLDSMDSLPFNDGENFDLHVIDKAGEAWSFPCFIEQSKSKASWCFPCVIEKSKSREFKTLEIKTISSKGFFLLHYMFRKGMEKKRRERKRGGRRA